MVYLCLRLLNLRGLLFSAIPCSLCGISRAKARGIFFGGGGVTEREVTMSGLGSGFSDVNKGGDDDTVFGG